MLMTGPIYYMRTVEKSSQNITNLHGSHTCQPVADSSAAALITPADVQYFAYGNWHGTMEI